MNAESFFLREYCIRLSALATPILSGVGKIIRRESSQQPQPSGVLYSTEKRKKRTVERIIINASTISREARSSTTYLSQLRTKCHTAQRHQVLETVCRGALLVQWCAHACACVHVTTISLFVLVLLWLGRHQAGYAASFAALKEDYRTTQPLILTLRATNGQ